MIQHSAVLSYALTEHLDHQAGLVDTVFVAATTRDLDGRPLLYTATVHSAKLGGFMSSAESDDPVFALAIAVDLVREAVAAPVKAGVA